MLSLYTEQRLFQYTWNVIKYFSSSWIFHILHISWLLFRCMGLLRYRSRRVSKVFFSFLYLICIWLPSCFGFAGWYCYCYCPKIRTELSIQKTNLNVPQEPWLYEMSENWNWHYKFLSNLFLSARTLCHVVGPLLSSNEEMKRIVKGMDCLLTVRSQEG